MGFCTTAGTWPTFILLFTHVYYPLFTLNRTVDGCVDTNRGCVGLFSCMRRKLEIYKFKLMDA